MVSVLSVLGICAVGGFGETVKFGLIADPQWGDSKMLIDGSLTDGEKVKRNQYEYSTIDDDLDNAFKKFDEKNVDLPPYTKQ